MVAHLIAGPEDGVHVSSMEAREAMPCLMRWDSPLRACICHLP